jgi:hypothetical protein
VDGNTDTTPTDQSARIARVTWFATFVVPLVLAALLLGVKSAQAASPLPEVVPLAFEEEEPELEDEAEFEFAEEECELAEEEAEEGELSRAEANEICKEAENRGKAAGSSSADAGECPLHSDSAHAATAHGRLKLTLGYTTNTPVKATIQIHAGSTNVGSFKRHLGKSGVLRFTEKLTERQQGNRISVQIKLPQGSAGCPSRRLVLFPR